MQATINLKNIATVPVYVCGTWIQAGGVGSVPATSIDNAVVVHYLDSNILELTTEATRVGPVEEPKPEPVKAKPAPKPAPTVAKETVAVKVEDTTEVVAKEEPVQASPKKKKRARPSPTPREASE